MTISAPFLAVAATLFAPDAFAVGCEGTTEIERYSDDGSAKPSKQPGNITLVIDPTANKVFAYDRYSIAFNDLCGDKCEVTMRPGLISLMSQSDPSSGAASIRSISLDRVGGRLIHDTQFGIPDNVTYLHMVSDMNCKRVPIPDPRSVQTKF